MSNNSNKFTTKDLYKELFHCRDFELQHLWQRSVFLAGFMIALFTLYGSFLGNRLNENEPIHGKEKIASTYRFSLNDLKNYTVGTKYSDLKEKTWLNEEIFNSGEEI